MVKTSKVLITPANGLTVEVVRSGSAIVCRGGAWPGMRIHFNPPSNENFLGESSEPIINGEAYFSPDGKFERFWVFCETAPTSGEKLELLVLDCADVVVNLTREVGRGWKQHKVGGANIGSLDVGIGTTTLYADAALGGAGKVNVTDAPHYWPRGYIGGGVQFTTLGGTGVVVLYQHLNPNGTRIAEYARFHLDQVDFGGVTMSCSFENGAQNHWSSTGTSSRNGPTLLPWPLYGLTVKLTALVSDLTDIQWLLYERSEG